MNIIPTKKPTCRSGVDSKQGIRRTMEDTHVNIDDVSSLYPRIYGSFYAVYDGHGGKSVADMCNMNLMNSIMKNMVEKGENETFVNVVSILNECFKKFDETTSEHKTCGSTAAILFISTGIMWSANLGDTEAIVGTNDSTKFNVLTTVHKPDLEADRITSQGGFVYNNRVDGRLAVSRAFGDFFFKKPSAQGNWVSAEPTITTYKIQECDKFVVLACDGLWDVLTYSDACDIVNKNFTLGPDKVAKILTDTALKKGSSDNVTSVVVYL